MNSNEHLHVAEIDTDSSEMEREGKNQPATINLQVNYRIHGDFKHKSLQTHVTMIYFSSKLSSCARSDGDNNKLNQSKVLSVYQVCHLFKSLLRIDVYVLCKGLLCALECSVHGAVPAHRKWSSSHRTAISQVNRDLFHLCTICGLIKSILTQYSMQWEMNGIILSDLCGTLKCKQTQWNHLVRIRLYSLSINTPHH